MLAGDRVSARNHGVVAVREKQVGMVAPASEESDAQLMGRAVNDLARRTRFPIVFGGLAHEGSIHVSSIAGTRTRNLDGLIVQAGRGLGGKDQTGRLTART